jgi:hypothetical protein
MGHHMRQYLLRQNYDWRTRYGADDDITFVKPEGEGTEWRQTLLAVQMPTAQGPVESVPVTSVTLLEISLGEREEDVSVAT